MGNGQFTRKPLEDEPMYRDLVARFSDSDPVTLARIREIVQCDRMIAEIDGTKKGRAARGAERLRWSRQREALLSQLEERPEPDDEPLTALERRYPNCTLSVLINAAHVELSAVYDTRCGNQAYRDYLRSLYEHCNPDWQAEMVAFLRRYDPQFLKKLGIES